MDEEDPQEGYDSDHIDPEQEYRLYDAIFFGSSSVTSLTGSKNSQPETGLIHRTLVTETDSEVFKSCKETSISDSRTFSASRTNLVNSQLTKSFVRVTSFRDDSDSDPESRLQNANSDHENISRSVQSNWNTINSFSESDVNSTSSSSDCQAVKWTTDDIVLGVSHTSQSSMCNLDDVIAIAKRLSNSGNDPGLWRISDMDRLPSRSSKNRYFKSSDDSVCYICRKRGHYASECDGSGPTCILCGEEGHTRDQCQEIYCYACLAPGHLKVECPLLGQLRKSVCQRCGQQGHCSSICTELWRQYRHTTKHGKPVELKRTVRHRGCCNCGRRGHCVDDCFRKPFRSNFLGPLPRRRVLVYDKRDIYKTARIRSGKMKKDGKKLIKSSKDSKGVKKKDKIKKCQKKLQSTTNRPKLLDDQSYSAIEQSVNRRLLDKVMEHELGCRLTNREPDQPGTSNPSSNSKSNSKAKQPKLQKPNSKKRPRKTKLRKLASESGSQRVSQSESGDACQSHFYLSDTESSRVHNLHNEVVHIDSGDLSRETNAMRKSSTYPSLMYTDPFALMKEKTKETSQTDQKIQPIDKCKNRKKLRSQEPDETDVQPCEIGHLSLRQSKRRRIHPKDSCFSTDSPTQTASTSLEPPIEQYHQSNPNWLNFITADSAIESWDSGPPSTPNTNQTRKRRKIRKSHENSSVRKAVKVKKNRNLTSQQT